MTTNNQNESVNHIPFLSEEMERTLCRLAWKDEIFREALIADPKGIIQYLFHQSLPNGKLPDDLTIKVIEQDASTRHIVLPALDEEEPIFEIAEEQQVDLIVNLGAFDRKRLRESDESRMPKGAKDKNKSTFGDNQFKRKRANDIQKRQEKYAKDIKKAPTEKEVTNALLNALKRDGEILEAVKQAHSSDGNLNGVIQMMQGRDTFPVSRFPRILPTKCSKMHQISTILSSHHLVMSLGLLSFLKRDNSNSLPLIQHDVGHR